MTDRKLRMLWLLLAGIMGSTVVQAQTPAALIHDSGVGTISFAAGDLKAALVQNGYSVTDLPLGDPSGATQSVRIILTTQATAVPGMSTISGITNQGYAIQRVVDGAAINWWVIGQDAPGAMYGGLELAEAVKLADGLVGVTNRQTNPYLANRGIKFNISLDARTPTYTEPSTAAKMTPYHSNVAEMWSTNFWNRYLDQLARHRYNTLSLWSESPFPSLVRVPEYPNTALADVQGRVFNPTNSTWSTVTHKTMTMDEKITFWRQVMQYARDRGIDVYIFTWNIFVKGTENSGYPLTTDPANATTKDWVRRATRTLFDTYPLLAGIGVTAGENMGGLSQAGKEQWCWDAFGLGVQDAVANAQNPTSPYYKTNRVIRLIHRAHQADLGQIISYFNGLPGYTNADSTFSFSFKYSEAHMHSSTKPLFIHQNNWFSSVPAGKKTWLTVRNDDLYYMRWGDPDFARAYMTNLPDRSKIAGFYMGPDGYCWGREFMSTEPESPRQQVIDKMWYSFLLWGRLAYEPTLPNSQFQGILGEEFPGMAGTNLTNLFTGWASVSKVFPLLTRFYWGALDFQWYPEACWNNQGFQTVQNFINPYWDPMQSNQDGDSPLLMSVKQYVNGDAPNGRLNPEQVADLLQQYADDGQTRIQSLSPGANKELRLTLGDIKAMAHLGRYYAEKIRGATDLYRFQSIGLADHYTNARVHLITASNHWSQYAAQWSTQYVGQVLIRQGSGIIDIAAIQANVNADVPAVVPPPPTFTLTTSALNGSIALNPPGGVYTTGTVVTVMGHGNYGYAFASWGGNLSGTLNPTTVTMNANKSVTASFVVTTNADAAPWLETFTLTDGARSHGWPTSWTATRASGVFEVITDRLTVNNSGGEGVLETGPIGISSGSVRASVEVQGQGGLDNALPNLDYVRFYKIVDGGAEVLIGEILGAVSGTRTLLGTNISGTTLKLRIRALVTSSDEYYFLDNLKVEYQVPRPTYTLTTSATNGSISLNPPGGVYTTGLVVTVTANPNIGYAFGNWSGDLSGSVNPTTLTMTGNKSVMANFSVLPPGNKSVLFVVGASGSNASDLAISNRLHGFGYTVQMVIDGQSNATNANGKGLVLISSTVGSANVTTKFRDVVVPVINWENGLQDDFGFATTSGNAPSQTALNITNPGHPLAAGLTAGVRTVVTASGDFSWGEPGGSPILIARLNDGTHPCLYAYEAGAAMSSGTAPARRVHLFLQNNTFSSLNADGLRLLDAAVRWAVPVRFLPPVLQGGQLRLEWVGGGTLQTANNVAGPWGDVPGGTSPFSADTTNSEQFFRVKQ